MVVIKANVRRQRAEDKLRRAIKRVKVIGAETVNELGEIGKFYAKSIAPRDTSRTADLIKFFKATPQMPEGKIVSQNSTAGRGDGFNLPRFLHKYPDWARNNNGDYLTQTLRELNSRKRDIARGNIRSGLRLK